MLTLHRSTNRIALTGEPASYRLRWTDYYRGTLIDVPILVNGPPVDVPDSAIVALVMPAIVERAVFNRDDVERARRLLESKLSRADTFVTEYVGAWENGSVKT